MPTEDKTFLVLINDAARQIRSEFGKRARDHKLSLLQWRTLGALGRHGPMTQAAIGARIEASPMTMSDIVARLEALGYVTREVDPSDSRAKVVHLAPDAGPIIDEMRVLAGDLTARALDGFSAEERAVMTNLLTRLTQNLESLSSSND